MDTSNLLNSPLVNKLLKFGLSKSGIAVTALVAFLIKKFGIDQIVPPDNLPEIKGALEAGGLAILACVYAWFASRQKAGVKAIQEAVNASSNDPVMIKVDGIAGDQTLRGVSKVADVPISEVTARIRE